MHRKLLDKLHLHSLFFLQIVSIFFSFLSANSPHVKNSLLNLNDAFSSSSQIGVGVVVGAVVGTIVVRGNVVIEIHASQVTGQAAFA